MRKIMILVFVLALSGMAAAQDTPPSGFERPTGEPLVIAHQGGDGLRPGNTMAAFQHAVELGVDVLEMDIHSTQDGVLVVIHDDTIDRTTDGRGRVQDFTFDELQAFDAGYHFPTLAGSTIEGHPFRGQGITIPALEEVFTAFPGYPMIIEIKQAEPSIVEPFCQMIGEYEMTEQVIVASFHTETTLEFRADCPDVATASTSVEVTQFLFLTLGDNAESFEAEFTAFQVPEMSGGITVVTPEFVEAAQSQGLSVDVWTVNTREQMERMFAFGVHGIITDYPDMVLEALGRGE